MQNYAKTPAEYRKIVDDLEKAIENALKTTTDRDLSEANAKIRVIFQGLDANIRSMAQETSRKIDSHLVDIRYGRIKATLPPEPKETEQPKEEKKQCKRQSKNTRRSKKSTTTS